MTYAIIAAIHQHAARDAALEAWLHDIPFTWIESKP